MGGTLTKTRLDPQSSTDTTTSFYPEEAGIGVLTAGYQVEGSNYSDTADLVVLAVSVAPAAAVMDTGETQVFTATPVPDTCPGRRSERA